MRTNSVNNLIFNAKIIKKPKVKRSDDISQKYVPDTVRFLKIDTTSPDEVRALSTAGRYWENSSSFATDIAYDAYLNSTCGEKADLRKEFFILTKQKDNFDKINCDDILGMAEITHKSKKKVILDYLQVNPEYVYQLGAPKFINCGRAIIKSIQQRNRNRTIELRSTLTAVPFYEKMGFKPKIEGYVEYYWKRVKKHKL